MGAGAEPWAARIAGRAGELKLLAEAIRAADEGRPCAFFVHGEAGVGKTRLVEETCRSAEERGFRALWGRCVHFAAATVPFAPIVGALESWFASAEDREHQLVLAGVDGLGQFLPSAGASALAEPGDRLASQVSTVIERIAAQRPTVIVVDDIQWADVTSLDVLAYLVTGFRAQHLALLVTYRDEGLDEGHPVHGWLADMRRLPSVHDLPLDRLAREGTDEQVATLLGATPTQQLVDAVHDRSRGNAYLNELLVRDLDPGATELAGELPHALREALLGSWHRLDQPAREVVRLLAVAGRPYRFEELARVGRAAGVDAGNLPRLLNQAARSGIVGVQSSGSYWFRHPLLAEVLYATFLPGEAAPLHSVFISELEETLSSSGPDRGEYLADLAVHYLRSGDRVAAYSRSIAAADSAASLGAHPEEAANLLRAVELTSGEVDTDKVEERRELLLRTTAACRRAGDLDGALSSAERALELVERGGDKLQIARALLDWRDVAFDSGRHPESPLPDLLRAVEISSTYPDSHEHIRAMTEVAETAAWEGNREVARAHADRAFEAATRNGSPELLARALGARAFAYLDEPWAEEVAAEAYRFALLSGQSEEIASTANFRANSLMVVGRLREALDVSLDAYDRTDDAGHGVHTGPVQIAAGLMTNLGELGAAQQLLRRALSSRPRWFTGAWTRLCAALLAIRLGHLDEADQHLLRASELCPLTEAFVGLETPTLLCEYMLSRGRPDEAVDQIHDALPAHAYDPHYTDLMLMWGARAAADLAQRGRDRRDDVAVESARRRLEDLVALRGTLPGTPFEPGDDGDLYHPAIGAVFRAEAARCRRDRTAAEEWRTAAAACRSVGLLWEEAVASLRLAQTLSREGAARSEVAPPVRTAHRLAVEMAAVPLRVEAEELARIARVPLSEPHVPVEREDSAGELGGLTEREREVLEHLVAGRTYAEIAQALYISPKTVSVHVSNLLRKTGTTNRHEVAALAQRHARG